MRCIQKTTFLTFLLMTCIFLFGISSFTQTITATVSGVVTDPNSAVVQGATVTITSNDTGQSKTAVTNDDGLYTVTFLQPGTYSIKAEKTGFSGISLTNVKLEVAQSAKFDLQLQVTGSAVQVEVDTTTPILQTETSNLETTIESKLVDSQ